MEIVYRRLKEDDLDTFIDMRITQLREYGCGAVQITASDMGVKLYTAYGFVHNNNFMQYKL